MKTFVNRNQKLREWSEPTDFHSSIWGTDGFNYVIRKDLRDVPNIYNIERYSILSVKEMRMTMQSPPEKDMSYHHTSAVPPELRNENIPPPSIIVSA